MSEEKYLQEAYNYYRQLWREAMRRAAARRLVIKASTLAALGGASALPSLLAACARAAEEGVAPGQLTSEGPEGRLARIHPYAEKYHWRKLPWPTTPYVDGLLITGGISNVGGLSSFELVTNAQSNAAFIWQRLMQTRYGPGADMDFVEMEPALADRVTPAKDFSYYDYHIRPNTYFHDFPPVNGRLCTAADVKYCLDVYRTEGILTAPLFVIDRVEVLDKETVRVHLKRPVLWLNHILGSPQYYIFAREHYEGPKEHWQQQPIGTGPLMVVSNKYREYTITRRHPRFSYRDERWPHLQLPFIRGADLLYIADAAATKSAFRTKQIDALITRGPEDIEDVLVTNPESVIQVLVPVSSYGPGTPWHLNNEDPLFQDVRVRRALNMAINRKEFIELADGGMAIPGHPISWNFLGRREPLAIEELGPWMQYNPTRARELLAEAGYPDGFEMEYLASSPLSDQDELTVRYLNAIGVRVRVNTQESTVVTNARLRRTYKHAIAGSFVSALTGIKVAREYYLPDSGVNVSKVNDPVMTELIEKATYTLDPDEQVRLLKQINDRALDQCYEIWRSAGFHVMIRHPWLQNVASATSGWGLQQGNHQMAILWIDDTAPGDRAGRRAA